jgi:hypothetical protein
MLQVLNLQVTPTHPDGPVITWDIMPTIEDIAAYRFVIERSESQEGPYEVVSPELIDSYQWIDRNVNLSNSHRFPYYIVRVINKLTGEIAIFGRVVQSGEDSSGNPLFRDFGPWRVQGEPDFPALEMIRRYNILLDRFVGVDAIVYIERTYGQKCDCFDRTLERITRGNCHRCFGTGWVNGFYTPIRTKVNFHPRPRTASITEMGELQGGDTAVRLSNLPRLKPRDIIRNMVTNDLWRVASVQTTEKRGFIVSQTCSLADVNNADIEYRLPVVDDDNMVDAFIGFGMRGSGLL